MSWKPELKSQFENVRSTLEANYNNNMNVVKGRTTAAALDYPNAKQEIDNSKSIIRGVINNLAEEADKLSGYLKELNEKNGRELASEIFQKENALRKLEVENRKYEQTAETRKAQAEDVNNKYEGNYHNQPFIYAPWEVDFSKWFSYTTGNPYINLHPSARSGLLFMAFFLGFTAIIVLFSKIAFTYYHLSPLAISQGISSFKGLFSNQSYNSQHQAIPKHVLARKF